MSNRNLRKYILINNTLDDEMKDRNNVSGRAITDEWMNGCEIEGGVPCIQSVEEIGLCSPL